MNRKVPYLLEETFNYLLKSLKHSTLTVNNFLPYPISKKTESFLTAFSKHCLIGLNSPFNSNPQPDVVAPIILHYFFGLKESLIGKEIISLLLRFQNDSIPIASKVLMVKSLIMFLPDNLISLIDELISFFSKLSHKIEPIPFSVGTLLGIALFGNELFNSFDNIVQDVHYFKFPDALCDVFDALIDSNCSLNDDYLQLLNYQFIVKVKFPITISQYSLLYHEAGIVTDLNGVKKIAHVDFGGFKVSLPFFALELVTYPNNSFHWNIFGKAINENDMNEPQNRFAESLCNQISSQHFDSIPSNYIIGRDKLSILAEIDQGASFPYKERLFGYLISFLHALPAPLIPERYAKLFFDVESQDGDLASKLFLYKLLIHYLPKPIQYLFKRILNLCYELSLIINGKPDSILNLIANDVISLNVGGTETIKINNKPLTFYRTEKKPNSLFLTLINHCSYLLYPKCSKLLYAEKELTQNAFNRKISCFLIARSNGKLTPITEALGEGVATLWFNNAPATYQISDCTLTIFDPDSPKKLTDNSEGDKNSDSIMEIQSITDALLPMNTYGIEDNIANEIEKESVSFEDFTGKLVLHYLKEESFVQ